ncbi:MAG: TIGR03936 family radical SAM-associated protein [Eubacteriaceae bacterium]|nr:TIGR03936 family radical SAM-associated protein [Eubacteriaceae bacterium]
MKYRLSYQKNDSMIYVSHLDLQRIFQRSFRRALVPVEYSTGFSPHPRFVYSPPLPLFVSSACEFLDFESIEGKADDIQKKLANALPKGIAINSLAPLGEHEKSLKALLYRAEFHIMLEGAANAKNDDLKLCYELAEMPFEKIGKKKKAVVTNLKQGAGSVRFEAGAACVSVYAELDASFDKLVRPSAFAQTLCEQLEPLKGAAVASIRKIGLIQAP